MWAGFRMSEFFSRFQLCQSFGKEKVIDVLEGTPLEAVGRRHGYDVFLIRNAVPIHALWNERIDNMFEKGKQIGVRSIQVRGHGSKAPRHYCSIHAVLRPCSCKYDYVGTARRPAVQLPDDEFDVMTEALDWLKVKCEFLSSGDPFNEVVINMYDLAGIKNAGAFHGTRMTTRCCLTRP